MKIIFLLLLIFLIEAKKKKAFDPLSVRPRTFDKVIYCNACQAIVRETFKKIKNSRSEVDVMAVLANICRTDFQGYAYVTGSIQLGCQVFMGGWSEHLEEKLLERKNNETFEDEFCVQFTKACEDIDPVKIQEQRRKLAEEGQYVTVDGKKYKPSPDGHIDLKNDIPIDENPNAQPPRNDL